MQSTDLNLLVALDALLEEESVVAAAMRLNLSPSAVSRTLSRIRETVKDPILVRAGRRLVPTRRAEALREQVRSAVEMAQLLLKPDNSINLEVLDRTFTILANDGFVEAFGASFLEYVNREAPRACIRFAPKSAKDVNALRDASIDIEIGVVGDTGPEVRIQTLFRDKFIGVVRADHPLAGAGCPISIEDYVAYRHISVSRRGRHHGPIDEVLEAKGLKRTIATVVPNFPAALVIAKMSDLIANVPAHQTKQARIGMLSFVLPVTTDEIIVSQMWHPRSDADQAHTWLRSCLRLVCVQATRRDPWYTEPSAHLNVLPESTAFNFPCTSADLA
jgi:DNA-binding transcriptional LysR family regulator